VREQVTVRQDGKNLVAWQDSIHVHLSLKFGSMGMGTFAKSMAFPERTFKSLAELGARFPDVPEEGLAGLARMHSSQIDRMLKQEERDHEDKIEMFAYLRSTVTQDGSKKVNLRTGFAEVEQASDPLGLLKLITLEHSTQKGNISERKPST
jgi:hypothetical protein